MPTAGSNVFGELERTVVRGLAEAASVDEALHATIPEVARWLGWQVAVVWMLDPDARLLRWAHAATAAPDQDSFVAVSRRLTFPPDVGLPGRVWRTGEPVWVPDVLADPNFPRMRAARDAGLQSAVGARLSAGERTHGVLELYSTTPRSLDPEQTETLTLVGEQLGQFISRLGVEDRLAASQEWSASIVRAALDCIVTMDATGRILDFNPAAEETFGYRRDEAVGRLVGDLIIPPDYRDRHHQALAHYNATREPTILNRRLELRALRADGSELPVELTVTRVGTREPPVFAGFVRDITDRQAALAREQDARRRAERAEREARRISEALQRSLLPPHLPAIAGIDFGEAYSAGTEGTQVGGDFYDVFDIGGRSWGIAIGDVRGKGVEAAAITGLARHTLRATAVHERDPAAVLAVLNRALLAEDDGRFCTAIFARLDLDAAAPSLTFSNGGHPGPLLVNAEGAVRDVGELGTLLGVVGDPVLRSTTVTLTPGDTVLLYTDGVTEAPTPDGRFGSSRLRALLPGAAAQGPAALVAEIERAVTRAAGGSLGDDMALLAFRVAGAARREPA